jgi:epoxyqueuosine reductase
MIGDLREQISALASDLGFDLCRFTPAEASEHAETFRAWLRSGAAGEMNYLERNSEKRCQPQSVLPDARTIIVLALNYFQGHRDAPKFPDWPSKIRAPKAGAARGRIARYAWGKDYHSLIEERLQPIDELLRAGGGRQKCYVDTGPILERDFAARGGIGWQGKSTMLVNRRFGTWFFLAEILTTLEFAPDAPERDHCGHCRRCIDACPTRAITAPYQLDARRCISYLTIELKGPIPLELRPLLGDRIYGCDDCLEACPWNRFAKASREAAFAMPPEIHAMRLRDYLGLDEEKFQALFRDSPIKRAKRRGFLRNVCVALGNVGGIDDLPALERAAKDPESLVAEHASWAIAQIRNRALYAK